MSKVNRFLWGLRNSACPFRKGLSMSFFILLFGFIAGIACALVLVAGQVARRESASFGTHGEDQIDQQLAAEMHHFTNDRYREFDRAAWSMFMRDSTIRMHFGDPSYLTEAQKEHFVDQTILNDRRNKRRVGHPLHFGPH